MGKKDFFEILYEDKDILVINKMPGISVIAERSKELNINLHSLLEKRLKSNILLVHRIDKETSGIVLFAKTPEAQTKLSTQFSDGKIGKNYLAIVEGKSLSKEWQEIDARILNTGTSVKVKVHREGKKALSQFKTVEEFSYSSLFEVIIKTGRTHQIRVHLAYAGYPLLVDKLYGKREAFYLSSIMSRKYNLKKGNEERPLMSRQTLHAHKISFKHPTTGKEVSFEASTPKDWNALINQLRKN